jgi:hypothetical protein
MNWRETFPGLAALTRRDWRVFLPGLVILAVAIGPLIIVSLLLSPFHVDLMGFAMAWGLLIMLPGTVVGVLVLIGGVFALFRSSSDSE